MNFLAHYFLDREHPNSFFAIGAATPDLLSIYNERFRIKKHHLKSLKDLNPEENAHFLRLGIERHFEADEAFHSSKFFGEETGFMNEELKKRFKTTSNQRKFFISHVLVELILDKVLINNNPNIINEYYEHYSNAAPFGALRQATEHVARHELPNYEHFLEKFLQNKYLTHYSEWDHIVFVLGRILRRVGVPNPDFISDPQFQSFLESAQSRIQNSYLDVFREMNLPAPKR